ncbi:MAG: hypothetical protein HQM04_19365 [Magnetococcales bacterium]|nr:hypothetical protein [Magnetococcales bacterium]
MESISDESPDEDPKRTLVKKIAESESINRSVSVRLFVSLDLVNSTTFKSKTPKWPIVLDRFYTLAESHIVSSPGVDDVDRFRVWKYVGDEVLFYRPVNRLEDIPRSIDLVFEKLNEISREIRSLCKEEGYPVGLLDVKATAWIALIQHQTDIDQLPDQARVVLGFGVKSGSA